MGWLQRMFGMEKPAGAQVNPEPAPAPPEVVEETQSEVIPAERVGLNGEYDQSGLAKRVALAFDEDARFEGIDSLWVAQLGTTVVLKGKVPSQDTLNQMVEVAQAVNGAEAVTTDQVTIG